ncbi:hypothetical protein AMATHDRAFT_83925 [Amanita thiersii Skay4041]|uniref:Uncharacterized protein n=1 Tax=Amanita thiersii Skay4041 TaxID=703135 RepID=A0A2A9NRR8_9AGAR|nr:hypothetical protein AMATHDRAFT_83925 [Amanita thiersii Skay4041]
MISGGAISRAARAAQASSSAAPVHSEDLQPNETVVKHQHRKLPPVIAASSVRNPNRAFRGCGTNFSRKYRRVAERNGGKRTGGMKRGVPSTGSTGLRGYADCDGRIPKRESNCDGRKRHGEMVFDQFYTKQGFDLKGEPSQTLPLPETATSRTGAFVECTKPYSIVLPELNRKSINPSFSGRYKIGRSKRELSAEGDSKLGLSNKRIKENPPELLNCCSTSSVVGPSITNDAKLDNTPVRVEQELKIKDEPRSPSPYVPSRRLITSGCQHFPLPDNCKKRHAAWRTNRSLFQAEKCAAIRKNGLTVVKVLFRSDSKINSCSSTPPPSSVTSKGPTTAGRSSDSATMDLATAIRLTQEANAGCPRKSIRLSLPSPSTPWRHSSSASGNIKTQPTVKSPLRGTGSLQVPTRISAPYSPSSSKLHKYKPASEPASRPKPLPLPRPRVASELNGSQSDSHPKLPLLPSQQQKSERHYLTQQEQKQMKDHLE